MAEPFENRDHIEVWLKKWPRDVLIILASRAALRAVPVFAKLIDQELGNNPIDDIVSPSLLAMATALSIGKWQDRPLYSHSVVNATSHAAFTAANAAAAHDFSLAADANAFPAFATYAARAAAHAVETAAASNHLSAVDAATDTLAFAAVIDAFFKEYAWDQDFIEASNSAQALSRQPLWAANAASFGTLNKDWQKLKTYLLGLNQD